MNKPKTDCFAYMDGAKPWCMALKSLCCSYGDCAFYKTKKFEAEQRKMCVATHREWYMKQNMQGCKAANLPVRKAMKKAGMIFRDLADLTGVPVHKLYAGLKYELPREEQAKLIMLIESASE